MFVKGAAEWGFHGGGAITVPGGKRDRQYWMLAARWGRILTPQISGGALRGNLEYSMEAVPAFVMRQSSTVYGGGFTPVQLSSKYIRHFSSGSLAVLFLPVTW
jgi:hypothetical protein